MITLRRLWHDLRWPLIALLVLEAICFSICCWIDRDRPWSLLKAIGLFLNSFGFAVGLWVFGNLIALLMKLLAGWRQTASTPATIISDGRTPLQRLQEEFETAYPGRLSKEQPPIPVNPPPNDDNPYSYR